MTDRIEYRAMQPSEERWVSALVVRSFQEFIGPKYPRQGVRDFLAYADPEALRSRVAREHVIQVAADGHAVVGMIDIDDFRHIDLLFVDKRHQGRGIAKELVTRAIQMCLEARPDLRELTADTSDQGKPMYESLGFEVMSPQMVEHGRTFTRMRRKLHNTGRR